MRPLHAVHISFCRSELSATELRGRLTYYKDDFLKALAGKRGVAIYASSAVDMRKAILDLVDEHFVVSVGGKRIATETVGTGADGSTLWIDYRCPLLAGTAPITIEHTLLFREYSDQMNLITMKRGEDELNFILTPSNSRADIQRGSAQ
jgi:hypothetical protein